MLKINEQPREPQQNKRWPLYALFVSTVAIAAAPQLAATEVPDWFEKRVLGTILDSVPESLTWIFTGRVIDSKNPPARFGIWPSLDP